MAFKMKGFPYSGKSPAKQTGADALAMSQARLNNQEYKKRLNEQAAEDNKPSKGISAITGTPLPQVEQAKIVYKDGKKYYQASDGSLHAGQVDDYEYELAQDKEMFPDGPPKPKYWYKINGKNVSKEAYIKYENKPGSDEIGKQTNDPDPYGRKANNHGRGPKTK